MRTKILSLFNATSLSMMMLLIAFGLNAQTNIYDDVIATSPNHTSLATALQQEGLVSVLQDNSATLTVFAPDDAAFDNLAAALGTDITGLLQSPDLGEILRYHVLGAVVPASAVNNGDIVTPAFTNINTVKLTKMTSGEVYANHAMVNAADLSADNGVVHSLDAVMLPNETVVDIAIDNNFNILTEAAITAELLPNLMDPFATYTVFAPTDEAFNNMATALNTDINGILSSPDLADILMYHALSSEVSSALVSHGMIVQPLNNTNTLKMSVTAAGKVYANQAELTTFDIMADNGVVHVSDAVLLPNETVVDIAIDNGFSTLTTALITAELLPMMTDPFAEFTVFAPTNQAFDNLAAELNTDINGLLALPNLRDVLNYHVLTAQVPSSGVTNGLIAQPISTTNTLKMTVTSTGEVYANQAEVTGFDITSDNGVVHILDAVVLPVETVVDVAIDNNFSSLTTAVVTAELLPSLTNPFAELTVFAPTDQAFDDIAAGLGTDLNGLLALPNLSDILTYHVLGTEVPSSGVTNGLIVQPLSSTNTLKMTVTASGDVYANQAQITATDILSDNGVVHVLNGVVLPNETVVDIAIDNNFSTLTTAVVTAELLPVLTDPLSEYTVFAPTDQAFDDIAAALNTDINGLLALPNLSDILTYHVLGAEVPASGVTNGLIVQPLSGTNTLKMTVTASGDVYANQAQVTATDIMSENGVVHVLNGVVLPNETVVDVAIDNGFTTLTSAVVTAELLPVLTDPLSEYTVFAPTDQAFDDLAAELNTDVAGILALPNLADVLLYHTVSGTVLSTDLSNGLVATAEGNDILVDLSSGVMVNDAMVTAVDVTSDNGVVHIIDKVLIPGTASIVEIEDVQIAVYPNPSSHKIQFNIEAGSEFEIVDGMGTVVKSGMSENGEVVISDLMRGNYFIRISDDQKISQGKFVKM